MSTPYLSKHKGPEGPRWALDQEFLDDSFSLKLLLSKPRAEMMTILRQSRKGESCQLELLAPIESYQEVWASGVTYLRSRDARKSESDTADIYDRVYDAGRPELFFKSLGWRAVPDRGLIRVREDSKWNVPEPELVLVLNSEGEIVGYTAGNDVSSRSIEGENPLYLPQAKTYDGSCSIGPGIIFCELETMEDLPISLEIFRGEICAFKGKTNTSKMKRKLGDLAGYLCKELSFPHGVFLMTGTGIIPDDQFTLEKNDLVVIKVGALELRNTVEE